MPPRKGWKLNPVTRKYEPPVEASTTTEQGEGTMQSGIDPLQKVITQQIAGIEPAADEAEAPMVAESKVEAAEVTSVSKEEKASVSEPTEPSSRKGTMIAELSSYGREIIYAQVASGYCMTTLYDDKKVCFYGGKSYAFPLSSTSDEKGGVKAERIFVHPDPTLEVDYPDGTVVAVVMYETQIVIEPFRNQDAIATLVFTNDQMKEICLPMSRTYPFTS